MKELRVGIFGLGRGGAFVGNSINNGGKIVAFCEKREKELIGLKEMYGEDTGVYTDFDEFIHHPGLDVVFIANFFNEHAACAIKALELGINVISECLSNVTMAEAVALVRAQQKSGALYQMLENYPYNVDTQEMARVYKGGSLGKALYCEGEYNHSIPRTGPANETNYMRKYHEHWRNHTPRTYYITHSIGPLMYITGATPKKVSAMPVYYPEGDDMFGPDVRDRAAIITTLNDDDSVFRVTGCSGFGGDCSGWRICCDKGQMETVRGSERHVALHYSEKFVPEGMEAHNTYKAEWNDPDEEKIKVASHDGSDFIAVRDCFDAIRGIKEPVFDVYRATTMSSVAILGHRSILNGCIPYDIPDFHNEEDLKKYENDHDTPFYDSFGGKPTIPASSR